jgi:hypothetical protein
MFNYIKEHLTFIQNKAQENLLSNMDHIACVNNTPSCMT